MLFIFAPDFTLSLFLFLFISLTFLLFISNFCCNNTNVLTENHHFREKWALCHNGKHCNDQPHRLVSTQNNAYEHSCQNIVFNNDHRYKLPYLHVTRHKCMRIHKHSCSTWDFNRCP